MSIKLLITGGTIDKSYNELNGELIFKNSYINIMLKQARCLVDIEEEIVFMKDSLDITSKERELLYQKILTSKQNRILITHGTDTMRESAKFLGEKKLSRVVVFTGAMIPFSFKNSDASFNLGVALGAIGVLKNGVYIAMNGKIFNWDNVVKNRDLGVFEEIN